MREHPEDHDQQADEDLLDALRAVAGQLDPVPQEALLAARSKLAYLRLDAEFAELVFDSATAEADVVAMRQEVAPTRHLSFEAGSAQVEVEVEPDGDRRRLIGQCIPTSDVEVSVRCEAQDASVPADPAIEVVSDDLGRFTVDVPAGFVSLRCAWPHAGLAVETAWVRV